MFEPRNPQDVMDDVEIVLKKQLSDIATIREQIKDLNMFEVGIRKRDNAIFYFSYHIWKNESDIRFQITASRLPPETAHRLDISIEEFKNDYIQYSQKSRAILPKRS